MNAMHAATAQILGIMEFDRSISQTETYRLISQIQIDILVPFKDFLTLVGLTYLFSFQG